METVELIVSIISTVGFPIAMCLMMYNRMNKESEQHHQDTVQYQQLLDNNTKAIEQLTIYIKDKGV